MAWPKCNSTLENQQIREVPVWHDYTFHRIGLWISAVFGLIAIALSFLLIYLHATHYLKPWEQKHIIRILFMVPVYAAVSFLSYKYYTHSVYFEVLRDCYEAFAIASFFSLLCHYIAADLHQQKNYFRTIQPRPWIWPMKYLQKCCGGEHGIWRTPRSGLTWFNVIWAGVFQYCFIRVFMTCVAVITQAFNIYCLESLNPAFSHVWVMVIEAVAVSIAMYCLIQYYVQIRRDIKQHKPLLKVLAIKLVIFLSFWQTILISFLTSAGAVKSSPKFQTPDIKVGIPAMLLCIEMAIFSVFHLWAFSYRPYVVGGKEYLAELSVSEEASPLNHNSTQYRGGFLGARAILDAMNPWDMIKAVARSARWLFKGRKHRENDSSYAVSRVQTNVDAFTPGQKLTDLQSGSTAYVGGEGRDYPTPLKPQPYAGHGYSEEDQNLLSNAQAFGGIHHPSGLRQESSPYRTDSNEPPNRQSEQGGDIGVAQTKDDADQAWRDHSQARLPRAQGAQVGFDQSYAGYSGPPTTIPPPYFDPPPTEPPRGRQR